MVSRGPLLLGALWVAAASLAVGVGLLAVDLVAGHVGDDVASPLDDDAVAQALTGASPSAVPTAVPTSTASGTPGPRPSAVSGPLRTVQTRGGVVSARCVAGEPRLVYATPREGYRTERAEDDDVRFRSSERIVRVRMDCQGVRLVAATSTREDEREPSPEPESRAPAPSPSEEDSPEPSETPEPRESESEDESDSDSGDSSDRTSADEG